MPILNSGVLVIDSNYNVTTDACDISPIPAEKDFAPGTMFFVQSLIGTIWGLLSMVFYRRNVNVLKDTNGKETVPMIWVWSNLDNGNAGWTAATYLTTWVVNLIVSVMEFVQWILLTMGKNRWMTWYTPTIGYGATLLLMPFTWIFPLFQLAFKDSMGGLNGDESEEFGYNSIWLIVINFFIWVGAAGNHLLLTTRYVCHAKTFLEPPPPNTVVCTIPPSPSIPNEQWQRACLKEYKRKMNAGNNAGDLEDEDEI